MADGLRGFFTEYWIGITMLAAAIVFFWAAAGVFQYFSYQRFIIASLLQGSAVFLALSLAFFFFEVREHRRRLRINASVDYALESVRSKSMATVINTTGTILELPENYMNWGPNTKEKTYQASRQLVVDRPPLQQDDRLLIEDSFRAYRGVLNRFQELANECTQLIRLLSSQLSEFHVLLDSIRALENIVSKETTVWEEFLSLQPTRETAYLAWEQHERGFPGQTRRPRTPEALPPEAKYNLLGIAEYAVRLIDVLDSKNFEGDPVYEHEKHLAPIMMWRSNEWGDRKPNAINPLS